MKINIFKIPHEKKQDLKDKFKKINLLFEDSRTINDWSCIFYLSKNPEIKKISWVEDYQMFIKNNVENKIYFAVFLCEKDKNLFALTYGKSHFYVRSFCDEEFGLKIAKRIANENDIKQIATKRFTGRKKKEIRSYTKTTIFDNESGESVEHINASIIEEKKSFFGDNAKFGTSLLLSKKELKVEEIPNLLDDILKTLNDKVKFDIPKTEEVKNKKDKIRYYNELLSNFLSIDNDITTNIETYNVIGVDFVFAGSEKYKLIYYSNESEQFDNLTMKEVVKFIKDNNIPKDRILNTKVEVEEEGRNSYKKNLKDFIDYKIKDENVIFQNGKWIRFNDEYRKQINSSVDSITKEQVEKEFEIIYKTEPEFNESQEIVNAGYKKDDKDFSKINIKGNYTVEAWDLRKEDTAYAVKFGNTQKLVYVCNQAIGTLEIIRNNANLKKLKNPPKKYCLWFGLTNKKIPDNISELNSIILKQQIDLFARKCREVGIEPVIKISQKVKLNKD